jgi:hypothetical protein
MEGKIKLYVYVKFCMKVSKSGTECPEMISEALENIL